MKRQVALLVGILFWTGCQDKDLVQYDGTRQLLTVNDVARTGEKLKPISVGKISFDSIAPGNELLVKLFLEDTDFKIIDAFLECKPLPNPYVDTMTYKISGCASGLFVENDTIFIGFRPTELGIHKFPEITILTRDKEKIFRTLKYSFNYNVVNPQ